MNSGEKHRNRAGITLVEVLATATLSVLLLMALSRAVRVIHRHERILARANDEVAPWRRRLREQLERDLLNSRQISVRADRLTLWGFAGRTPLGRATLLPAELHYSIERRGEESWLIRESISSAGRNSQVGEQTILGDGIYQIAIGRPEDDLPSLRNMAPSHQPYTIPAQVRCVLFDRSREPIVDFLVWQEREAP